MNIVDEKSNKLHLLKKEVEDFRKKYSVLLTKYQQKHLVSARRIVEKRKDSNSITMTDVDDVFYFFNKEISDICENINVKHENVSYSPNKVELSYLEAIRKGLQLMKRDIPELLSTKVLGIPHKYEKYFSSTGGELIQENVKMIIHLREEEITILFSFLHSLYKDLPSIIKGKGGDR